MANLSLVTTSNDEIRKSIVDVFLPLDDAARFAVVDGSRYGLSFDHFVSLAVYARHR